MNFCLLVRNFPVEYLCAETLKFIPFSSQYIWNDNNLDFDRNFISCSIWWDWQNSREETLLWLLIFVTLYGRKNLQKNNTTQWLRSSIWVWKQVLYELWWTTKEKLTNKNYMIEKEVEKGRWIFRDVSSRPKSRLICGISKTGDLLIKILRSLMKIK